MRRQLGQVPRFPLSLSHGLTSKPSDQPDHIHRGGREQLLEVRARQPDVATAAQSKAPRALREATLHPGPQGVLGFERRRLLPLAGGLDGLVVGLQPDRELPWGAFRRGARRWAGHMRQVGPSHRRRITGSPETSCPGRQWTLVWPWGQRAC